MNVIVKDALTAVIGFLRNKRNRRLLFLALLGIFAFIEFMVLGLVRRTFVFYSINEGMMTVEDRMLKRSPSRELDIARYVEEALLGPISPDMAPLFPQDTRLLSLLYRDGVVYADLSESAALSPLEGGDVFRNLYTLNAGIRRNFSFIKDVRLFIAGKAGYYDDFQRIFSNENQK
ncbi:MAG: GerMN domain-containing protein [Treponema sp.]|jgi:hypothetical protein|nr:GerMN domain-containing protein [Treponema sp.]